MDKYDNFLQKNTRQAGKVIDMNLNYFLTWFIIGILCFQFLGKNAAAGFEPADHFVGDGDVTIGCPVDGLVHLEPHPLEFRII